jgi:hypothetical protein
MAESKSDCFCSKIKGCSEKIGKMASFSINSLAGDSECGTEPMSRAAHIKSQNSPNRDRNGAPASYRNGVLGDAKRQALKVLVDRLLHGDRTRRVITSS